MSFDSTPRRIRVPAVHFAALAAITLPALAVAQTAVLPTLDHCAAIGASADRLACYDKLIPNAFKADNRSSVTVAGASSTDHSLGMPP